MANELFLVQYRHNMMVETTYVVSDSLKKVVEKHENAFKIERVKENLEVL